VLRECGPRTALSRLVGERRARILETLRTAKTTGDVAEAAGIAESTASEHLHELVLAQVVKRFRSGRFVYYALTKVGELLVDELGMAVRAR
jgi:DNA-binding transcriptional ArsR family regulator